MLTRRACRGLTLIEVLVALALWAVMTVMMTQGLDVVMRSQRHQVERDDQTARLRTLLAQWQIDLNQLDPVASARLPMDWNGRVLRWVRINNQPSAGQRSVVAWGQVAGRWVRWQSAPVNTMPALMSAWQESLAFYAAPVLTATGSDSDWPPVQAWQVVFYRNNSWSNALSSSGTDAPASPDAVRLQLDLGPQGLWQGRLQWDWVRPNWSVNRS
jgi:general secretion pathway protein J